MAVLARIVDAFFGTSHGAGVTSRGQLVTAPLEYNDPYFKQLTSINAAFNFISPKAGMQFVLDGYLMSAAKDVSNTDGATIVIYEADSPTSTIVQKQILQVNLLKLAGRDIVGLNLLSNPGRWINAKTDDATVDITLLGYFVTVNGN